MAEPAPAGWERAIGDLEELLDAVELALETGVWDPDAFDLPAPADPPPGAPSPEQRQRAAALLVEVDEARERLTGRMAAIRDELDIGGQRRRAASRYARADRLPT